MRDGRSWKSFGTHPLPAAVIVLVLYAVLALLNSDGGYLGTDTGAKVATLDEMVETDTVRPVVGYWAEEWDPDGDFHPLFDSRQNDEGEWINVTTVPLLEASRPLYDLGGYRLALLFPALGALGAAFACRDVARQLADDAAGWRAFWLTAIGSPIAIYALDFWEHSLGAALMVAAFSALLRVLGGRSAWYLPVLAGLAFGASATMRTETFVVALAFVGVTCGTLAVRREFVAAVRTGLLTMVGFAGPWFANAALEEAVGATSRADRVSGATQREFWTEIPTRFEEALVTWFGLPGYAYPTGAVLGVAAVVCMIVATGVRNLGDEHRRGLILAIGALCYLLALSTGLGFVSGALVASPVAVVGLLSARRVGLERITVLAALLATVITWTYQYTGGAGPQWGGRYLLAPTLLLTALGAVILARVPATAARWLPVFAVVVTTFGTAWLYERSHEVDDYFTELAERPEDVVVSTNGFLVREAGPAYEDRLYLSLGRGTELSGAIGVVRDAGHETFAVLGPGSEPPEVDAEFVDTDRTEFLGSTLWYHRFRLS